MGQDVTICYEIFFMIMRTSLLVAGVKHCSVFLESGGSGKS